MNTGFKFAATELLQIIAKGVTHNGLTLWASKHGINLQAGGQLYDRIRMAARSVSQ
jgi:hypothetical protein